MRAGWNSAADARVHSKDSARSFPMLDIPGWLESQRLPNAVAVINALNGGPALAPRWCSVADRYSTGAEWLSARISDPADSSG